MIPLEIMLASIGFAVFLGVFIGNWIANKSSECSFKIMQTRLERYQSKIADLERENSGDEWKEAE